MLDQWVAGQYNRTRQLQLKAAGLDNSAEAQRQRSGRTAMEVEQPETMTVGLGFHGDFLPLFTLCVSKQR